MHLLDLYKQGICHVVESESARERQEDEWQARCPFCLRHEVNIDLGIIFLSMSDVFLILYINEKMYYEHNGLAQSGTNYKSSI